MKRRLTLFASAAAFAAALVGCGSDKKAVIPDKEYEGIKSDAEVPQGKGKKSPPPAPDAKKTVETSEPPG